MSSIPSVDTLAHIVGGKVSRDGETVVIGYGNDGYLRLVPDYVVSYVGDERIERPAARIDGKLLSGTGGAKTALRATLEAAGIYPRG